MPDEYDTSSLDSRKPSPGSWEKYLARIKKRPFGKYAIPFWKNISQYKVGVPVAGPYEPDVLLNGMQMVWDVDEHHVDVDILEDGSFEWFYMNRFTNENDSGSQKNVNETFSQSFVLRIQTITGKKD